LLAWAVTWLILIAIVLLGLAWHEWPDDMQPAFNASRPLAPGDKLGEPLALTRGGLYGIDILLTRQGPVDGLVLLRVTADAQGVEELSRGTAPASAAEDLSQTIRRPYAFVTFRFPPLEASGGASVWLWLESEADGTLGVRYREGTGKMALRSYYRRSLEGNLALFGRRLSKTSGGILSSAWVLLSLFAMYAGLAAVLVVTVGATLFAGVMDRKHRLM
jgi:hypothetical protein